VVLLEEVVYLALAYVGLDEVRVLFQAGIAVVQPSLPVHELGVAGGSVGVHLVDSHRRAAATKRTVSERKSGVRGCARDGEQEQAYVSTSAEDGVVLGQCCTLLWRDTVVSAH
jgi:hypothetical protein